MNDSGFWIIGAFATGFVVAQLIKLIIGLITKDSQKAKWTSNLSTAVRYLMRSGGMPSGHAASFTAVTVFLGCVEGFSSAIFALAVCTTAIVVYDAVNVRYAVGEQGKILAKLANNSHLEKHKLRVVEGHTVPQVLAGIALGIIIGLTFWIIY